MLIYSVVWAGPCRLPFLSSFQFFFFFFFILRRTWKIKSPQLPRIFPTFFRVSVLTRLYSQSSASWRNPSVPVVARQRELSLPVATVATLK